MVTRILSGHIESQPEGLQQLVAAQRVPDPCRSVKKLHEIVPDCEKMFGPSQHFQVTKWMESMDGKEKHDSFNSKMEGKQPTTTQASAKNRLRIKQQQLQREEEVTRTEKGQRQRTSNKLLQPAIQNPKA
ncbi:hypothetical protein O181_074348 [Austropuccinia psidii MF-1]|uniref:Uncharacterized protein n=1 Tax=Austropuccinia psidii MF-1 TaxID=1389203 RepID=A0A9Q3F6R7_9BASI|nr:hypothetical protein [Austropuccinia psidii MF-1]